MDSLTRAPVSSFFSETLGGLATIRAFGQKSRFMKLMLARMDIHNNTFLVLSAANRWLGVALVLTVPVTRSIAGAGARAGVTISHSKERIQLHTVLQCAVNLGPMMIWRIVDGEK